MKTLTQTFEEILNLPHIAPGGRIGRDAVLYQLLQAVKERDKYLIGENIPLSEASIKPAWYKKERDSKIEAMNILRAEQRKWAKESL